MKDILSEGFQDSTPTEDPITIFPHFCLGVMIASRHHTLVVMGLDQKLQLQPTKENIKKYW